MPRILIADDDPGVAGLRASLVCDGLCVEVATTGQEVLLHVERKLPDLVLVDPTIPGTRGWDLCRRLIEEHHLPVIVLAHRGRELDAILALDLGADDFLPKSCNPREVAGRVRAVLRRYAANRRA